MQPLEDPVTVASLAPGAAAQADTPGGPVAATPAPRTVEFDGPEGLEPTRFGDWERKGRCIDF